MSQTFKVGDKVQVIAGGDIGTVVANRFSVIVELEDGIGYAFKPEELVAYPVEFRVGDRVKAFGCHGVVTKIGSESVFAEFKTTEGPVVNGFYADGKRMDWHAEPSLKLIARAKPKKRKKARTIEAYANVYEHGGFVLHDSERAADIGATPLRVACVKLIGSYTLEVDDE